MGPQNTLASSSPFHGGEPGSTPGGPTMFVQLNWLEYLADIQAVSRSSREANTNTGKSLRGKAAIFIAVQLSWQSSSFIRKGSLIRIQPLQLNEWGHRLVGQDTSLSRWKSRVRPPLVPLHSVSSVGRAAGLHPAGRWFEAVIEYYRDLGQWLVQRSPKAFTGVRISQSLLNFYSTVR